MGKIIAFVLGTVSLSLFLLMTIYVAFKRIETKFQEINIFQKAITPLWQDYAIIVFVVVVSVGTLMALLIWGGNKKNVL